jgi:hypothetical protein
MNYKTKSKAARVTRTRPARIGMCIPALADPGELEDWIEFLERDGESERLAFARMQRTEAVSATVQ